MTYRVEIDRDECMSAGRCVVEAPSAFGFDDEELAVALDGVGDLDDAEVLRIARRCPSQAILVFAESGERIDT